MANSIVKLFVDDSGFNAGLKRAASSFSSFTKNLSSAKSGFAGLADAISKSTAAQQALNAVIKGNPYGAMLSMAQVGIQKIIEKTTELNDVQRRMMDDAQRRAEEQQAHNNAIGKSVGDLMAKYEVLRTTWLSLSSDHEKNQWIKDNQSAFNGLGLSVKDVTSAEDAFVNNTNKVVAALEARARAEAYADLYKEQIKKNYKDRANPTLDNGWMVQTVNPNVRNINQEKLAGITASDINWKKQNVYKNGAVSTETSFGSYNESGIRKLQQLYDIGAASKRNVGVMTEDRLKNLMLQARIDQNNAYAALGALGSGGGAGGGKGGNGSKIEVPVKPVYIPEEGTPDFVKAMISDMQSKLGKEKDASVRADMLLDIKSLQDEYKSMTTLEPTEGIEDPFVEALSPLQQLNAELEQLKQNLELSPNTEAYQQGLQAIADKEKEIAQFKGVSITKEIGKDADTSAKSFRNAASAISSMGNAMSQIEDPAAKIAGMIAESVASIALGFSQAIGKDAGSKGSVWYAIAAAAAGVASMITTISAIHSATGYAEGGIVQGNSYSGDNLRGSDFGINAGELILNKAQQSTLASQLQGTGLHNLSVAGKIKGTDIILSIDRSLQLQGKQLLTWGS